MSNNTRSGDFLKECISDALIKLMHTKPIEKISVDEITELAGVGRATYFRKFSSKKEVLTFKLIQLWNRWADEHNIPHQYSLGNAVDFFEFNYHIRDIHKLIYDAGVQSTVYDAFYQIIMPHNENDIGECYKNTFYTYGLFGLLNEWIKSGYSESPKKMAHIYWNAILSGPPKRSTDAKE